MSELIKVFVAICTYQRNSELARLLDSVLVAAEAAPDIAVGVSIADDNADGRAAVVAEEYDDRFALGVTYTLSAAANISVARNHSLTGALGVADWVALTDDDCVVPEEWFVEHLECQRRFDCDATTGMMKIRFPDGPRWLEDEQFENFGLLVREDGERTDRCSTNNSIISADWLRSHPDLRFDPELGRIGGEDMVFFRAAVEAGLHARYARNAPVYQVETADRSSLRYQLRRALWMGNTEAVTNLRAGDAGRFRLFLRGGNHLRRALVRVPLRVARREPPQLRYALASVMKALGTMIGAVGVELSHK